MKKILLKSLIFIIILTLSLNNLFIFAEPSKWAVDSCKQMYLKNLLGDDLSNPDLMKQSITREEFAELAVRAYAYYSGVTVSSLVEWNPFADTDNLMVAKAFNLKIVNGIGFDKKNRRLYNPKKLITRQEISIMLMNLISALDKDISNRTKLNFSDTDNISSWAYDAVSFAVSEKIIEGVGNNKLNPKSNATRDQAITIVYRILNKYMPNFKSYKNIFGEYKEIDLKKHLNFYIPVNTDVITFKEDKKIKYQISYLVNGDFTDIKEQINVVKYSLAKSNISYSNMKEIFSVLDNSFDENNFIKQSKIIKLNNGSIKIETTDKILIEVIL